MRQGKPLYLPVWQLILFSVLTLGTYTIYWYYRTWKYLKDTTKENMSAGWRTFGMAVPVVNLFVGFLFFQKIDRLAKLRRSPAFLTALFGLAPFIAYWIPLSGLLVFVPLGIAQSALNGSAPVEKMHWSKAEIIACTLLAILLSPVGAVAIAGVVRTFVLSPFQVAGSAMADTLTDKDYLIVSNWAYQTGDPQRGDIVVFHPPSDPQKYYLQRIIGLPKETVIIRDGNVYIHRGLEEVKLAEPYLNALNQGKTFRYPPLSGDTSEARYEVPDNHYFVLGDNRQGSLDSRSFSSLKRDAIPYVSREAITGKVWFVALPRTDMRVIERPMYPAGLR